MYLLLFFIAILCFYYFIILKDRNYWKNKNVPYFKQIPIFGNYKECLLMKKHINLVEREMCLKFPNEPYFGAFFGTSPVLIIQDPSLVKLVISKDFYYFNGREISDHTHKEMFTKMMFFVGGDEWKLLRVNLTPLFTSNKLKNMFYLIKDCADDMEALIAEELKTSPNLEVKSLITRYTIDCITTCVFGFNSHTMKQKNGIEQNPFTILAKKIFDRSFSGALKNLVRSMWPEIFYALGFKIFEDDAVTFFSNIILKELKKRNECKMQSSRKDFLDLLLAWKTDNYVSGNSLSNAKEGYKSNKIKVEVNNEFIIAQCVLLFGAGYETTATTLSFILYELAKNKTAQEKVIQEVDEYFAKCNSIEYECINTMPYTEACVNECLRLYPVLGVITREVMHDYCLPTGLQLKKCDRIHIPVYHIHHSPDYFPEPEVFRPERFLAEETVHIKPYTHLPFGEGPRICIGLRFSKMPTHAAILKIFKNYRVELAEGMPHKLAINPMGGATTQSIGGIYLKFIARQV